LEDLVVQAYETHCTKSWQILQTRHKTVLLNTEKTAVNILRKLTARKVKQHKQRHR